MKKNKKVHIYYLFLGIGIGLVLGSAMNILNPDVKYKEYTEAEIREKAMGLGMRDLDEVFKMNEQLNEKIEESLEKKAVNEQNLDSEVEGSNESQENNAGDMEEDRINQEVQENGQEKDAVEEAQTNVQEKDISQEAQGNTKEEDATGVSDKNNVDEAEEVEYVEFEIKEGDGSGVIIDNLYKANIIDDKEAFVKAVIKRRAARKLNYGVFRLQKGIDKVNYDTIIDILTQ